MTHLDEPVSLEHRCVATLPDSLLQIA